MAKTTKTTAIARIAKKAAKGTMPKATAKALKAIEAKKVSKVVAPAKGQAEKLRALAETRHARAKELQRTYKAKDAKAAKPSKGKAVTRVSGGRPENPSEADLACQKLLARKTGATRAEIRKVTGWKGRIFNGPTRAAEALGKRLKWEGSGEDCRFTLSR